MFTSSARYNSGSAGQQWLSLLRTFQRVVFRVLPVKSSNSVRRRLCCCCGTGGVAGVAAAAVDGRLVSAAANQAEAGSLKDARRG